MWLGFSMAWHELVDVSERLTTDVVLGLSFL